MGPDISGERVVQGINMIDIQMLKVCREEAPAPCASSCKKSNEIRSITSQYSVCQGVLAAPYSAI